MVLCIEQTAQYHAPEFSANWADCDAILQFNVLWEWLAARRLSSSPLQITSLDKLDKIGLGERNRDNVMYY